MATLLIVGSREGTQRCDARCHDARPTTPCDCVCAGRYHSLGRAKAITQCQQDVSDGRYGAELVHIARHLSGDATQSPLF